MQPSLTEKVKTIRLKPDGSGYTVAAGAADVTSEAVDTQGYDGVRFVIGFGAIVAGAATSIKARQGAQANMSDGADLASTSQTVADSDDNKVRVVDIWRPQERYLDLKTLRATQNSTIDFLLAELYAPRAKPVTADATVAGQEIHSSPAEGTA